MTGRRPPLHPNTLTVRGLQQQAAGLGYVLLHRTPSSFVLKTCERLESWVKLIQHECGIRTLAVIDDPCTMHKLAAVLRDDRMLRSAALYVGPFVVRNALSLVPLTKKFLEETVGEKPPCPVCKTSREVSMLECPQCHGHACHTCIDKLAVTAYHQGKRVFPCPFCSFEIGFATV